MHVLFYQNWSTKYFSVDFSCARGVMEFLILFVFFSLQTSLFVLLNIFFTFYVSRIFFSSKILKTFLSDYPYFFLKLKTTNLSFWKPNFFDSEHFRKKKLNISKKRCHFWGGACISLTRIEPLIEMFHIFWSNFNHWVINLGLLIRWTNFIFLNHFEIFFSYIELVLWFAGLAMQFQPERFTWNAGESF